MVSDESIYLETQMTSREQEAIERLTESKNWDYPQFNQVIVALAAAEEFIPAHNRPDSIHIQGLSPKITHLAELSEEYGLEIGQAVFADVETGKFIFGKVTKGKLEGKQHSVRIDRTTQEGREDLQKMVLTMHIHPGGEQSMGGGMGYSDKDYTEFISDREQMGQIIKVGKTVFLNLKTSVTPNNMDPEDVQRRIKQIEKETITDSIKIDVERLIDFNKAVCTEFGMVLYMATEKTRDLMERVPVAV